MPSLPILNPTEIELEGVLYSGMEGTVVKGRFNQAPVAVKRFAIRNSHSVARFDKEAQVLELETLRNVVRPVGIVRTAPHYWLVLPYFARGDLGRVSREDSNISLPLALCLCLDAAVALASVHESGLVFRDFKSANVLVDDSYHAYLTDFGSVQNLAKGIEKEENDMGPTGGFHKRRFECRSSH